MGAANIGKTLYFGASDGTHGVELWRSDGNYRRTRLVKDIDRTPDASGLCCGMTKLDGTLLFGAHDAGIHGGELWTSDGTARGTRIVKTIYPGGPYLFCCTGLAKLDGAAYFSAGGGGGPTGEELWRTDGTGAGTRLVKDIYPGTEGSWPAEITVLGGKLLFRATDGGPYDYALWESDGTAAGTKLVQ